MPIGPVAGSLHLEWREMKTRPRLCGEGEYMNNANNSVESDTVEHV